MLSPTPISFHAGLDYQRSEKEVGKTQTLSVSPEGDD